MFTLFLPANVTKEIVVDSRKESYLFLQTLLSLNQYTNDGN